MKKVVFALAAMLTAVVGLGSVASAGVYPPADNPVTVGDGIAAAGDEITVTATCAVPETSRSRSWATPLPLLVLPRLAQTRVWPRLPGLQRRSSMPQVYLARMQCLLWVAFLAISAQLTWLLRRRSRQRRLLPRLADFPRPVLMALASLRASPSVSSPPALCCSLWQRSAVASPLQPDPIHTDHRASPSGGARCAFSAQFSFPELRSDISVRSVAVGYFRSIRMASGISARYVRAEIPDTTEIPDAGECAWVRRREGRTRRWRRTTRRSRQFRHRGRSTAPNPAS
jgi:hypothetical protein